MVAYLPNVETTADGRRSAGLNTTAPANTAVVRHICVAGKQQR